ncbi:DUF4199 domain-containing protein [Hymenobacter jeollabukensis]|uniref:DUF4199 domain-containing protein n=1 Tax=Hymenobacter jeollabukensis TaxID=2025313 RepID=A0A5R8WKC5_9BACT|nr:DUF4199 domain-containing protein [Hymenobacter jeollabukensis]TLM89238.1 DUF4199 domain-containing protein [Hymenobacter jeollabukensis]
MENTTTSTVTTTAAGLRFGVITGIVTIIYSFILMMTGMEQNSAMGIITFIILIGGIVLAHRYFKEHNAGFMSYGQGLGIATIEGAVIGLLSGIFRYIYITFIDPQYVENAMNALRAKFEADGKMSDEQIDQAVQMTQKFSGTGPVGILFAVLGTAFFAFLLSLIVSAITKRNRPEFE